MARRQSKRSLYGFVLQPLLPALLAAACASGGAAAASTSEVYDAASVPPGSAPIRVPATTVGDPTPARYDELSADATDDVVRIRLLDLSDPREIRIAGHDGSVRLYAADYDDEIARLDDGEEAVVRLAGGQLHVQLGDLRLFANSLRAESDPGAETVIRIEGGSSPVDARRYQGKLRIGRDEAGAELKLVNELDLEDYVAAVVSTEYGFDDLEGSKAMAVIIRTYTLAVMNKYGGDYDHVDHTLSQVYRGTDRITPTIREAVRQTRGEVLRHDGDLIEAVYFSSSGGHTADNETVWRSKPLPYLRGKADPYGRSSPHAEWTSRISRPELLSALSAAYGEVTGFAIGDRSGDGRVATIDLLRAAGERRTIRANEFRMLVMKHFGPRALRSTLFTARRQGDAYVFEGSGNGHGVGLSQWGAHELAQRGTSYREILDFYYTDVSLEPLDELHAEAESALPQNEPEDERTPTRIGW